MILVTEATGAVDREGVALLVAAGQKARVSVRAAGGANRLAAARVVRARRATAGPIILS
jgi:hypothetical protein